ncbi:hypothetical protein LIER_05030 [Lithospermum erythrorhizon]|uniref:Uncharacterized protein n=1 Tax=Lithospermum erythrorhizon TaxID=34254 RepID=A0AAV3P1P4_LITER
MGAFKCIIKGPFNGHSFCPSSINCIYVITYTLNILKLLNFVSSCLLNPSQDRVSLLHALQLTENSPSVAAKHLSNIKFEERKKSSGKGSKKGSCKESVIHEALVVMKSISFWVFGVLLSGLCSDVKPYIEMGKLVGRFDEPLFRVLDRKVEREILRKKENLVGALGTKNTEIAASELRSRLEVVEKLLDGLEKETSNMFREILDVRNNLLDNSVR